VTFVGTGINLLNSDGVRRHYRDSRTLESMIDSLEDSQYINAEAVVMLTQILQTGTLFEHAIQPTESLQIDNSLQNQTIFVTDKDLRFMSNRMLVIWHDVDHYFVIAIEIPEGTSGERGSAFIMDSLATGPNGRHKAAVKAIKRVINCQRKLLCELIPDGKLPDLETLVIKNIIIPQQKSSDCGIFSAYNAITASSILSHSKKELLTSGHFSKFKHLEWCTQEKATDLRTDFRNILKKERKLRFVKRALTSPENEESPKRKAPRMDIDLLGQIDSKLDQLLQIQYTQPKTTGKGSSGGIDMRFEDANQLENLIQQWKEKWITNGRYQGDSTTSSLVPGPGPATKPPQKKFGVTIRSQNLEDIGTKNPENNKWSCTTCRIKEQTEKEFKDHLERQHNPVAIVRIDPAVNTVHVYKTNTESQKAAMEVNPSGWFKVNVNELESQNLYYSFM